MIVFICYKKASLMSADSYTFLRIQKDSKKLYSFNKVVIVNSLIKSMNTQNPRKLSGFHISRMISLMLKGI